MSRSDFQYLIGIAYVLTVLQIEARLTQTPNDTVVFLRDSVIFGCLTERKDYPPSWYHTKVGSTEARDVYTIVRNGNNIVGRMTQEYHERMEVLEDRGTGEYSLRIKSVQSDDAGQYRCTARGGLGQSASAELTVIKSAVHCHTNASELLGEHVCDHEPDNVKISCSFEVTGNNLPNVSWVKTDNIGESLITETARWSVDRASASSSFVLKADEPGLDGSSYMCIVSESSSIPTDRQTCTTPILHVIRLKHVFGSKTLEAPAEVRCPPIPRVTETGSKWIRRSSEQSGSVIIVTNDRTLNLYKPEMLPGDYACMIDCNIGNKQCEVEALTVNYQNNETAIPEPTPAVGLSDRTTLIITTVVVTVVVCIVIAVTAYFVITKFAKGPQLDRNIELRQIEERDRERIHMNGDAVHNGNGPIIPDVARAAPMEELNNVARDEQRELLGSSRSSCNTGHSSVSVDVPDAKIGKPGDRDLRLRLIEERARARMQMNAELRQGSSSPENGDVAEGLHFNAEDKKSS